MEFSFALSTVEPPPTIWEDDDYVYIPEALFEHLPKEYQMAAQARKGEGSTLLQVADRDLKAVVRLMNAIPTTSSLSYIFHRLRTTRFEPTAEGFMEQELLTTAFVVSYARLFASGTGGSGVSRDSLPVHLRTVHDDIMDIRNQRYAHNGSHASIGTELQIDFDDDGVRIRPVMSMGLYIGGRNEWEEIIGFLDALMHERLQKILARLSSKTGKEWTIPTAPAPEWVGKYGHEALAPDE